MYRTLRNMHKRFRDLHLKEFESRVVTAIKIKEMTFQISRPFNIYSSSFIIIIIKASSLYIGRDGRASHQQQTWWLAEELFTALPWFDQKLKFLGVVVPYSLHTSSQGYKSFVKKKLVTL